MKHPMHKLLPTANNSKEKQSGVIQLKKYAFLFLTGGTIYPALEIACRGRTDPSMAAAGGICLCLIDRVCNTGFKSRPLAMKCFAGSGIITSVEFVTGLLVNIILKLNVWDYSAMPLNVLGQICVPFSILWFLATIPAMGICCLFDKSKYLSKWQNHLSPEFFKISGDFFNIFIDIYPINVIL